MSTIILAIDPGAHGAYAIRYPGGNTAVYPFTSESDLCEALRDLAVLKEAHRKKEQEEKEACLKRIQEHEEYVLARELKKDEIRARLMEQHNRKLSQELEEREKPPHRASSPDYCKK